MVYKKFKDIELSRLGMGNMRLPIKPGGDGKDIDYDKAQEIIDYAMANGINYYDTAYVYHGGESEVFLGTALKKYPRDSYYVASKFHIDANPDYKGVFEEQFRRLDMDCIDFYLIHCVTDGNIEKYFTSGAIDFFKEQKAAGKIKYLGFSSHASTQSLERFADAADWDFAQIQLNYFDWNFSATAKEYEILNSRNIPIMVMESVRGGRLSQLTPDTEAMLKEVHPDWSISSWAFRWLKRLDGVQVSLSGMTTLDQIIDNVATYADDYALSDEEEELLFKVVHMFREQVKVPCTACRYCTDGCPKQINIPEVLKVYNNFKINGGWALQALKNIDTKGGPKDCIGCGKCTKHCPQNINIPAAMKEMADAM